MKKYTIYGFLIIFAMIGYSCSDTSTDANKGSNGNDDDDDENPIPEETTVEDDIINLETSMDITASLLDELGEGTFIGSLKTFLGASSGNFDSEDWAEEVLVGLEDFIDVESIEDNSRFNFADHTGLYEWDTNSETWSKSSSSDHIVLEFPASENSSGNDMIFTISEYTDASTNVDGDNIYLPTRVQAQIELDGAVIFQLNLNELQYSNNSDLPVPERLDLEIFTAPFTQTLTVDRNSGTDFVLSYELSNEEDLVIGTSLELKLAHSDYGNLDDEDFENLSGTINLTEDLLLTFDAQLGMLFAIDDPSENQINSLVEGEVAYKGVKIADLEYSEEDENIVIFYKDGSSDTADKYYEDFLEELELIFYAFTGDW